MGWWLGRILTFEVVADDAPPTIAAVLADASVGAIQCDTDQELVGFAAYGRSIKSAVEPLVDCFGIRLFDDGTQLRPPSSSLATIIGEDEFGNAADNATAPRLHREQLPVRAVPAALRLSYYDPERDYQTGEARSVAGEQDGNEVQQQLPAVLAAAGAKSLAQEMLARAWAGRDRLTLHLPPKQLALEPGTRLELPLHPSSWTLDKTSIQGFVVVAELRPSTERTVAIVADGGRIVPNSDVAEGPLSLALFDIPNVLGLASNDPTALLAATTSTSGWKRRPVDVSFAGQRLVAESARSKSLLGVAATVLAVGGADLIDQRNQVDVILVDGDQWLTSCDDDALAGGENLAVLGSEIFQFGEAMPLGGGRFRLSKLLRGRGGTEWACADHVANEMFCVIQAAALQPISLPPWSRGAAVTATTAGAASASIEFEAENLRPPSPVKLTAQHQDNGDLVLSWTRRSRQGWAWVDEVDAPLGEAAEQYRVVITGTLSGVEVVTAQPTFTLAAADSEALGTGMATIEVRQTGDLAASRPAQLGIIQS